MKYIYPYVTSLEKLHKKLINIWLEKWEGGFLWYHKKRENLESIIYFIQNDNYYPDFEDKLTHIVFSITQNHIFVDWNKRSAIYFWAYFMILNGFDYVVEKFIREMENIVLYIAKDKIEKNLLYEIVVSILYEDTFSEELNIKLLDSIS